MNIPKQLIKIILFGNIYVAFGAVCLLQSTFIQCHLIPSLSYSFLVFFSTLFIYNLQRIYYSSNKSQTVAERRNWLSENQTIVKLLTFVGGAGVCVSFFFSDYKIIYYFSPLLILSVAYFIPQIKLRKNAWFKLLTLACVWTVVTSVVPILIQNPNRPFDFLSDWKICFHVLSRFVFMLAISIPFDIRDIETDRSENISTLPQRLGESNARWLAVFMVILYSLMLIVELGSKFIPFPIFIALMINMSITLFLVLLSAGKRNEYYFVGAIDGMMILQGLLVMIFYKFI